MEEKYYKLISKIIKEELIKQDISANQLAYLANVDHSYISKILNNRYIGDETTLKYIFSKLYINFTLDKEHLEILNHKLNEFLYHLFFNNSSITSIIEDIINNETTYIYSLCIHRYYLIRYIWAVSTNNNEDTNKYKTLLNKILKLIQFDLPDQQIYLDYQAIHHQMNHQLDKSIHLLLKAKELGKFKHSYGMVCYHLGMAYDKNNDLVEALLNQYEAMDIFNSELNIKRYLYVRVHIANTLSRNHNYEKAEKIYLSILNQVNESNLSFMYHITLENHIWNLIKQEKYTKSKEYLLDIDNPNLNNYTYNYYFQSALIYYHLNDYSQSLIWINKGKEIILDETIIYKLTIIEQLIFSNSEELLLSLKDYIKININKLESETIKFIVSNIINLSEEKHYYKDAFYYQKKYMKYLI